MHSAVPGTELRVLRKALGMTLAELADGIVTIGFLSAVETGNKLIHRDKLAALMARLEAAANAVPESQTELAQGALHAQLRVAISKGQREVAEKAVAQLRSRSLGDEPILMLAEGQLQATFGDPEIAYGYLQAAVWRLPKPSDSWFRAVIDLCQLGVERGHEAEAVAIGKEAISLLPLAELDADTELELRAAVAGAFSLAGAHSDAFEVLDAPQQILELASDWGRVTRLWASAQALEAAGDFEAAALRGREALSLLAPLGRQLTLARLRNAVAANEILRNEPDWEFAEELLQQSAESMQSLSANVDLGQILGTLGDLYSLKGDFEAAENCFIRALELLPESSEATKAGTRIEYATALLRISKVEPARAQLQAAQLLLQNSTDRSRYRLQLWHRLAHMFEQLGDLPAALACIKEAAR